MEKKNTEVKEDSFLNMIIRKLKGRREITRRGGWRIVREKKDKL